LKQTAALRNKKKKMGYRAMKQTHPVGGSSKHKCRLIGCHVNMKVREGKKKKKTYKLGVRS